MRDDGPKQNGRRRSSLSERRFLLATPLQTPRAAFALEKRRFMRLERRPRYATPLHTSEPASAPRERRSRILKRRYANRRRSGTVERSFTHGLRLDKHNGCSAAGDAFC